MKILPDEALQRMQTAVQSDDKNQLTGVHSYDILANPLYLDDFQYFSASLEKRETYIVDDDSDEENDAA